jgi:hypothetical protein
VRHRGRDLVADLACAAEFAAWVGSWPCWWLVKVAQIGSALPAGTVPWPGGVFGGVLLAAVTAVLIVGVRSRAARRFASVIDNHSLHNNMRVVIKEEQMTYIRATARGPAAYADNEHRGHRR